jgi:hypothetical protein
MIKKKHLASFTLLVPWKVWNEKCPGVQEQERTALGAL